MLTSDSNFNSAIQHRREPLFGLIGNTAMIPLRFPDVGRTVHAKCEFLNPSGSIKDRLARSIVIDAENRGLLHVNSIILECTSGYGSRLPHSYHPVRPSITVLQY